MMNSVKNRLVKRVPFIFGAIGGILVVSGFALLLS